MAATVSAWAKPGAWALDAEENETELLKQRKEDVAGNNGHSNGAETADFPSLSAAAATKTKKKKKNQAISLQEFTAYRPAKPDVFQPKGLTPVELLSLPTGPRERSAEELDRNKLGGGFRSYGGGIRDEQPRRQGSFNRDSDREFMPSRADETDNWAMGKKSPASGGFERRDRGERGGFFTDSQSRADEVANWASSKSSVPSEPRRYEKRGGFGLESSNGGSDSDNWVKRKDDEGRRIGSAFDSLRERRGGSDVDSESWGRKREEVSGGGRPRLNLQPRTLPVGEEQKGEVASVVKPKASNPFGQARPREEVLKEKGQDWKEIEEKLESVGEEQKGEVASVVKPKASNPFGQARPREEVLKEKGQDWKEIEEKLESVKIKEIASIGPAAAKRSFWSGNGRDRLRMEDKAENAWRKPESVGSRPQSAGESENGSAVNTENGHAEEAEERDTQI